MTAFLRTKGSTTPQPMHAEAMHGAERRGPDFGWKILSQTYDSRLVHHVYNICNQFCPWCPLQVQHIMCWLFNPFAKACSRLLLRRVLEAKRQWPLSQGSNTSKLSCYGRISVSVSPISYRFRQRPLLRVRFARSTKFNAVCDMQLIIIDQVSELCGRPVHISCCTTFL